MVNLRQNIFKILSIYLFFYCFDAFAYSTPVDIENNAGIDINGLIDEKSLGIWETDCSAPESLVLIARNHTLGGLPMAFFPVPEKLDWGSKQNVSLYNVPSLEELEFRMYFFGYTYFFSDQLQIFKAPGSIKFKLYEDHGRVVVENTSIIYGSSPTGVKTPLFKSTNGKIDHTWTAEEFVTAETGRLSFKLEIENKTPKLLSKLNESGNCKLLRRVVGYSEDRFPNLNLGNPKLVANEVKTFVSSIHAEKVLGDGSTVVTGSSSNLNSKFECIITNKDQLQCRMVMPATDRTSSAVSVVENVEHAKIYQIFQNTVLEYKEKGGADKYFLLRKSYAYDKKCESNPQFIFSEGVYKSNYCLLPITKKEQNEILRYSENIQDLMTCSSAFCNSSDLINSFVLQSIEGSAGIIPSHFEIFDIETGTVIDISKFQKNFKFRKVIKLADQVIDPSTGWIHYLDNKGAVRSLVYFTNYMRGSKDPLFLKVQLLPEMARGKVFENIYLSAGRLFGHTKDGKVENIRVYGYSSASSVIESPWVF